MNTPHDVILFGQALPTTAKKHRGLPSFVVRGSQALTDFNMFFLGGVELRPGEGWKQSQATFFWGGFD